MMQEPDCIGSDAREDTIDPNWAAIVLDAPDRHAARDWLSAQARRAGLAEVRVLRPAAVSPPKSGAVRVDQTLSFEVSDLRNADDGRVTIRQSFELESERRQSAAPPAMVTQTPRVLWLRGAKAFERAVRLVRELDTKLGRAAAVPVLEVKGENHRYAIDPWLVHIRLKPQEHVPQGLRQYLDYDEDKRLFGGRWVTARFKKPLEDSGAFAKRFYEMVGPGVVLGYRDLPLTVRSAGIGVPDDEYYLTGPSRSPGQIMTLDMIRAPHMWGGLQRSGGNTVNVFLFDRGAVNAGDDIRVHPTLSIDALDAPPGLPLPTGSFPPWENDPHGPYMASVMGARWSLPGEGGGSMAGVFGGFPETISIISVRCQTLAEISNGLAHVTNFMQTHPARAKRGVAVFGLDVLWLCKQAIFDPARGFKPLVIMFQDALEEAQIPDPGRADVLAVIPVGNFSPGEVEDIPGDIGGISASTLLVSACGLSPGNSRWARSRHGGALSPHLTAPGEYILAARSAVQHDRVEGTSFAAAHVAGVAALLRMADTKNRNAAQVAEILTGTATTLPPGMMASTADPPVLHAEFGEGRVNAEAALASL